MAHGSRHIVAFALAAVVGIAAAAGGYAVIRHFDLLGGRPTKPGEPRAVTVSLTPATPAWEERKPAEAPSEPIAAQRFGAAEFAGPQQSAALADPSAVSTPPPPTVAPELPAPPQAPSAPGPDSPAANAPPPNSLAYLPPEPAVPPQPQPQPVVAVPPPHAGLSILHIGDSHTSADFFTGAIRKLLQTRYGVGGPGYVVAGLPANVMSEAFEIEATPGWTYSAIQRSSDIADFTLSGFNSAAAKAGETLTFAAHQPVAYDTIEVEALQRPGGGMVEIRADGVLICRCSLEATAPQRTAFRMIRPPGAPETFRRLTISTVDDRPVVISSLGVYKAGGIAYSPVGFPGATVDILNKFEPALLNDELQRLAPQLIVLSFGTNEADNDGIDIARYRQKYLAVIDKIRRALPAAVLVMILPPDGERFSEHCKGQGPTADCRPNPPGGPQALLADKACAWHTIPNLALVRDTQRQIAENEKIPTWDWSEMTATTCGAHAWVKSTPKLMSPDHVHFTIEGYRRSAERFVQFLTLILEANSLVPNAVSNN
ncbi:MAG: GDSL-type esterase/lipase family protein [Ancalomicrobiaceae bacterium]|nr:GDSL-type esterase/lipase family protein [Ancalomicrobiaceae bacterium]